MGNYKIDQVEASSDFDRNVYCLFGLPVDHLSMSAAKAMIREKSQSKHKIVLSTININWVVRSFIDNGFRDGIINSDFVSIDGKPLLWLGKSIGLPMRETVAGSTLIQELLEEKTDRPLTIFLFGGEEKTAEIAMKRLRERAGGLYPVGALNPGFGTVEEMSTDRIINTINQASPDILLVSLGAVKGVAWIEKNRDKLNAGIISHLGAAINFLAGTIKRAPRFMQDYGLEWVWRICQEPKMFSRFAGDGIVLAKTLLRRLPLWVRYRRSRQGYLNREFDQEKIEVGYEEGESVIIISLGCHVNAGENPSLRSLLYRVAFIDKDLILDFKATEYVDGEFLGQLLILKKYQNRQLRRLLIRNLSDRVAKLFQLYGLYLNLA